MLKITPLIFIILITCSKISAQTNKIESTGNVGIGTLNPSSKLEVKSDASQGPLRIFGPNSYMLIDNVEFIKANKHLPEIPSASEISEKGISLGDINAKLLKKIEELTLYLIEKDKQMKNLEERLQQVEGKIK